MNKRVLVVIQILRRGGVELAAINFATKLNRDSFDVSFLLVNPDDNQDEMLQKELSEQGYNIYFVPKTCKGYLQRYRYLCSFFAENKFDVVHSHVIFFSGIVLAAAKKSNIPVRAAHSHITKWNHNESLKYKFYKSFMRVLINNCATVKFACSDEAGIFLYGKKSYAKNGVYIPNAVDCQHFAFDDNKRRQIRNEFNVSDSTVLVGHIGTVYRIKNQSFLVQVVSNMIKTNQDIKCIMVGEPIEREQVEQKAAELGISEKVFFAGSRADTDAFYSAFDIMIFPSLHEGLPLSLIEAQAAQLPCLVSDSVNHSVKYNSNVEFKSLDESTDKWSESAFKLVAIPRNSVSIDALINDYDINATIKKLEFYYNN